MNKKKYLDLSVKGFIIGDAVGMPYEFKKRGTFQCTKIRSSSINDAHFLLPIGTWSDDSSLMLCVLKSLNHVDFEKHWNLNAAKFMFFGCFTNHFFRIPYDVGKTCMKGIIYSILGRKNPRANNIRSNGNGGLMRMLPIAFIDCDDIDKILSFVTSINKNSHGHYISNIGCLIYILLIKKLLRNDQNLHELLFQIKNEIKNYHASEYERILTGAIIDMPADEIKSTGYVVDTLESAIWAMANSTNYEDAILKAINLGGDTDTIAAITGSMAAIRYQSYSEQWWNKIKRKKFVEKLLAKSKIC